jgi:hypothetical protein
MQDEMLNSSRFDLTQREVSASTSSLSAKPSGFSDIASR